MVCGHIQVEMMMMKMMMHGLKMFGLKCVMFVDIWVVMLGLCGHIQVEMMVQSNLVGLI